MIPRHAGGKPFNTVVLERDQRLSRSLLWQQQRRYYEQQGILAWSQAHVPHYITNNPYIAGSYARMTLAFLRDCLSNGLMADNNEPVYVIELGAGSGRFGYHFLKRFFRLLESSALRNLRVTYLLTDLSRRNADFWLAHPRLKPFLESGRLEVAVFDPLQDQQFALLYSGKTLSTADFLNPTVVLANYFFDSIPQDAFYLDSGLFSEDLVTLAGDDLQAPLSQLAVTFRQRFASVDYYDDADFNQLLRFYQQKLQRTHLLFPVGGLRTLRSLFKFTNRRMLLIAGDRGYYRLDDVARQPEPKFYLHDQCVSMAVNFHAMSQYTRLRGGETYCTCHRPDGLVLSAHLLGGMPGAFLETQQVFQEAIEDGGPDDFFMLKKAVEPQYDGLPLDQLLAILRLSGYDSTLLAGMLPAIEQQLPVLDEARQEQLFAVLNRVWDMAYPIGEGFNLPLVMAKLYASLGCIHEALACLEEAQSIYGTNEETARLLDRLHQHDWGIDMSLDRGTVLNN